MSIFNNCVKLRVRLVPGPASEQFLGQPLPHSRLRLGALSAPGLLFTRQCSLQACRQLGSNTEGQRLAEQITHIRTEPGARCA